MYEYLEGRVAHQAPARLVLDVGGVGYDLAVPVGAAWSAPKGVARAWTHLVVREDAHRLYGFPDRASRDLFRLLLSVRGVGPGTALGILSGLPRDELVAAILREDADALTRVKGVGKKTAQQVLLDLKDRALQLDGASAPAATAAAPAGELEDAVGALISIGYSEKEARRSVERAAKAVAPGELEALVRKALTL